MTDFTIDSTQITDLEGATANDPDVLDLMFGEIVSQHDAAFHASTGHTHSGSTGDGPPISSGVGTLTVTELGRLFFAYGGIT